MSTQRKKDTESRRLFPSLTSMVSGIKDAVLRRNSINSSVWSLETVDKARKVSMMSMEEPNITRHGNKDEREHELHIPCTETDPPQARESYHLHGTETDPPQAIDTDQHHVKETDPIKP